MPPTQTTAPRMCRARAKAVMRGLRVRGTAAVYMPPYADPCKRGEHHRQDAMPGTLYRLIDRARFLGAYLRRVYRYARLRPRAKRLARESNAPQIRSEVQWSEANGHGWSQRSQRCRRHAAADGASRFLRRRLRRGDAAGA